MSYRFPKRNQRGWKYVGSDHFGVTYKKRFGKHGSAYRYYFSPTKYIQKVLGRGKK